MESNALKKEPVVIVFSILAALQVISAGLGLADTLDEDVVEIIVLVIAAIQAAATFYVRGMVAPWDTVVTQLTHEGMVFDGPAAGGVGRPPTPPPGPSGV